MKIENMKKILLTALFAMGASLAATAQTEIENFVPGATLEGVSYFLPRTALRVTVETEKTVVTPGDLNKYAFRYLRLNDVPTTGSTTYAIKSIKVEPYGVIDNKKAYSVKVKSKTIAPLVTLTPDGILLSVNKEVAQPTPTATPNDVPAPKQLNPRDFMSQDILAAGSTAKMAELCAQEIYDIRESRNALVRGEADNLPKDGAQLQIMLSQLDQQAAALEQLFKGTTSTSTHYTVFNVIPETEGENIILRFSQKLGIVDADDLAGAPIYLSLSPTAPLPARVTDESVDKKKAKMEKGIYYNVPVRETIKIYDARNTYTQIECPMAQFGTTEVLSETLFNKGATTRVSFFPETGGIEKLEQ